MRRKTHKDAEYNEVLMSMFGGTEYEEEYGHVVMCKSLPDIRFVRPFANSEVYIDTSESPDKLPGKLLLALDRMKGELETLEILIHTRSK